MAPLDQFIMLGDSITQGAFDQARGFAMGAELQQAYIRRFDVINRGYAAYNTKNALRVIDHIFPTPKQASVKFLTIWFGANDGNKELAHNQYVPVEKFRENILTIINHPLVKAHSPNIILITNPPLEETVLWQLMLEQEWGGESRKQVDAQEYAATMKAIGAELGIPVVDVWGKFMEKAGWKEGEELIGTSDKGKDEGLADLLYDGLHLAPPGYRIVYDELAKTIKEKWPEYPPYTMPYKVKLPWEIERGEEFWDVNP